MTNYDAIASSLYPYDVDDLTIEKYCIDMGVDKEGKYDVSVKESVARIAIDILREILYNLSSESNAGYSLSYDTDKLKERIFNIAKHNGFKDIVEEFNPRPKVYINCD